MARLSSLSRAKDQILDFFSTSAGTVYTDADIEDILEKKRPAWRLAKRLGPESLIGLLTEHGDLQRHYFYSADYRRTMRRYSWGSASPLALVKTLKTRGYLCHGTAAMLHGLGEFDSNTIYLNVEQSPKPSRPGSLTQSSLDLAFSRQQRQSNLRYAYNDDVSVVMIAGKSTDQLGVENIKGPTSEILKATNIARTLIDIVVRPAYAGGLSAVLKAYRAAKDKTTVEDILSVLKQLNYVYPYHQAIGFLMDAAGYLASSSAKMRMLGLNYDFYLSHGMSDREYSENWRLFYPKGLIEEA